jgi:hypothetical protein
MKQIYPASITGKGFAEGGSVLDHKFGDSDPFTLGVEEEYMLLDPQSFDLVHHVDTMLTAVQNGEFIERIGPELMQSVLEISTPVCHTAGDVDRELRRSVSSSASESPRATATGTSSTSSSTSPAASSSSGCTCMSRWTTARRRSR